MQISHFHLTFRRVLFLHLKCDSVSQSVGGHDLLSGMQVNYSLTLPQFATTTNDQGEGGRVADFEIVATNPWQIPGFVIMTLTGTRNKG